MLGAWRRIGLGLAFALAMAPFAFGDGLDWVRKWEDAKARAKEEKKQLLINFTGSDWCGWCKRLEGEVFASGEFLAAANESYVFVFLDFPRGDEAKKQVVDPAVNDDLAKKYGVGGFPTIVLADAEGRPYARTGYQEGGPAKYLEHLKQLEESGRKIRALSATKKEGPELEAALAAALPEMVKQGVIDYAGYDEYLQLARKHDPEGKLGLLPIVLTVEENRAIAALLENVPGGEPDWSRAYELLAKSPHANGETFVNAAYYCAGWLMGENRHADAKGLLERILGDSVVRENPQAQKLAKERLSECEAALNKKA